MKQVKILGLAAMAAMALAAFLGAGSVSATVLCKTTITTGCAAAGWNYPPGERVVISADGSFTVRSTEGSLANTCTESTIEATTENAGSATETVKTPVVERSTWGGCVEEPTNTLEKGRFEFHRLADNPETPGTEMGTVTGLGWKMTTKIFGVSCTFTTGKSDDLGEVTDVSETGRGTATVDVHAVVTGSGFLCPSSAVWEGHWWITSPKPLYVAET